METEYERDGTDEQEAPTFEPSDEELNTEAEPELTEADILAAEMADRGEPEPEPFSNIHAAAEAGAEEDPPEAAVSDESAKAIKRVRAYVEKNREAMLGEMADSFTDCLVCTYWQIPGLMPMTDCPPEIHAALLGWLGERPQDEYQRDGYSRECEACAGLGETLTGSKVMGQERLPCIPCKGMGWLAVGDERATGQMYAPPPSGLRSPEGELVTPPTFLPAPDDTPEIAALKAKGYLVMPPVIPAG